MTLNAYDAYQKWLTISSAKHYFKYKEAELFVLVYYQDITSLQYCFYFDLWPWKYRSRQFQKQIIQNIDQETDKFRFIGNGCHYWLPANFH